MPQIPTTPPTNALNAPRRYTEEIQRDSARKRERERERRGEA